LAESICVGVSGPGVLHIDDVQKMAKDPIIFAMANPEPEIDPEAAAPYVRVLATGRSDYPNQINNVLYFPGRQAGESISMMLILEDGPGCSLRLRDGSISRRRRKRSFIFGKGEYQRRYLFIC
jgi:hypothetical protein